MSDQEQLRILIADDTATDRLILERIVSKQGHEVISASNGEEAVRLFQQEQPDIILMDVLMPVMDGRQATRQIKEMAGDVFVPIIFLTSLTDTESLVDCLEAGGDDFLSKPYSPVVLRAKIKAFDRMRQMHTEVQAQRDEIAAHNARLVNEQEVAKKVFDNVAHRGCLDAPMVRYYLSPMAIFDGDILLAAFAPSGNMFVLMGDFTGHGLPAAIGAMPLASAFYSMVSKGFAMRDLVGELNSRLMDILPSGFFCCAGVAELDFEHGSMQAWIGGLPDCYLYRADTGTIEHLVSRNLPLGVVGKDRFKDDCEHYLVNPGDRLFLWTDGIIEAENIHGEMYGEDRVQKIFEASAGNIDQAFDGIVNGVLEYIGGGERADDISMVELTICDPESVSEEYIPSLQASRQGANDWSFELELRPDTLRDFNPSPLLLTLLREIPGLMPHLTPLYTVLTELFSNALDHGLLALDSAMKNTPAGFSQYYAERTKRLKSLTQGMIRLKLIHSPIPNGGELRIIVEDSGVGFDASKLQKKLNDNVGYSGRGLPLVNELCQKLSFGSDPNSIEALFSWQYSQK
ncbi:MAG: fused response regulator/phosphatase [Cellvibrionaceae bacterium]